MKKFLDCLHGYISESRVIFNPRRQSWLPHTRVPQDQIKDGFAAAGRRDKPAALFRPPASKADDGRVMRQDVAPTSLNLMENLVRSAFLIIRAGLSRELNQSVLPMRGSPHTPCLQFTGGTSLSVVNCNLQVLFLRQC